MSRQESGLLGAIAARPTQVKQRDERVQVYLENPRCCDYCAVPLPYHKRNNKFCSHSCAGSQNDRLFPKRKNEKKCVYCGKLVNTKRKYCDDLCREAIRGTSHFSAKKKLIQVFGRTCSMCGLREWLEGPMPIELDHINGDWRDNSLENIRLLCPNCHTLTENYKRKNLGKGRFTLTGRTTKR